MDHQADSPRLQEVSSMLSREICRPIDSLQANLVRLLDDPTRPPSEVERNHASTMLALCEDLRRLTRECLGDGTAVEAAGPETVSTSRAGQ